MSTLERSEEIQSIIDNQREVMKADREDKKERQIEESENSHEGPTSMEVFRMEHMYRNASLIRQTFETMYENPTISQEELTVAVQETGLVFDPELAEDLIETMFELRRRVEDSIQVFGSQEALEEALPDLLASRMPDGLRDYEPKGKISLDLSNPMVLTVEFESDEDYLRYVDHTAIEDKRQDVYSTGSFFSSYTMRVDDKAVAPCLLLINKGVNYQEYEHLQINASQHETRHAEHFVLASALNIRHKKVEVVDERVMITEADKTDYVFPSIVTFSQQDRLWGRSYELANASHVAKVLKEGRKEQEREENIEMLVDFALSLAKDEYLVEMFSGESSLIKDNKLKQLESVESYDYFGLLDIPTGSPLHEELHAIFKDKFSRNVEKISYLSSRYERLPDLSSERLENMRWTFAQIPIDQWDDAFERMPFDQEVSEIEEVYHMFSALRMTTTCTTEGVEFPTYHDPNLVGSYETAYGEFIDYLNSRTDESMYQYSVDFSKRLQPLLETVRASPQALLYMDLNNALSSFRTIDREQFDKNFETIKAIAADRPEDLPSYLASIRGQEE